MFEGYKAMRCKLYKSMPEEEKEEFVKRAVDHAAHNHGEVINVKVEEEFNGGFTAYVTHFEDL